MTTSPEHIDTIVIGGGQAGLSVSYHLKQRGIPHLVLDRHGPGWAWQHQRWDSFCLVTPNWQCQLPDFPYDGPEPQGFMGKDAIVAYVRAFADFVDPPLRSGVTVQAVSRGADGDFLVSTDHGDFQARSVVVAIGANHTPITVPAVQSGLPDSVRQLHAMSYRNPQDLPEGDVLIIGTGQSGCQIAEDCHLAGRQVHLAVGSAPRSPRRYRGRDVVDWLDELGHYALTVDEHPLGKGAAAKTNHYVTGRGGGHEIDLRAFHLEGMGLFGRLEGLADGRLEFGDDLTTNLDSADASAFKIRAMIDGWIDKKGIDAPTEPAYVPPWAPGPDHPRSLSLDGIGSVIWCMGFRADFSFVQFPIFDERGVPHHQRGITEESGLAFVGLPWQHTWGSGRFASVGEDAGYVVDRLVSGVLI
jgi:putative flavoprotein involved in K+ transport